jgi:hypothetical protein
LSRNASYRFSIFKLYIVRKKDILQDTMKERKKDILQDTMKE